METDRNMWVINSFRDDMGYRVHKYMRQEKTMAPNMLGSKRGECRRKWKLLFRVWSVGSGKPLFRVYGSGKEKWKAVVTPIVESRRKFGLWHVTE